VDEGQPYRELAGALRERLAIIGDRAAYERDPAAHLESLKAVSQKIETAGADLPRPVPGDLAHYLKGSSYQKALAWLEAHGFTS
jgi:hypothetical protein